MEKPNNNDSIAQLLIRNIVNAVDENLIERRRKYVSLAYGNELLIEKGILSKEDQQNKVLKKILEEGHIKHAYQTEDKPKQWRIPLSEDGKKKYEEIKKLRRKNRSQTNIDNPSIVCPFCNSHLIIPKEVIKEEIIMCLNCHGEIVNPYHKNYNGVVVKCPTCFVNLNISNEMMNERYIGCPYCGTNFKNPLRKKAETNKISELKQKQDLKYEEDQSFQSWYNELSPRQKKGFKRLIFIVVITLIIVIINIVPDNRPEHIKTLDQKFIGREWTTDLNTYFNSQYGPGSPLYFHDQMWVYYYPKGDFTLKVAKSNNRILEISKGKKSK